MKVATASPVDCLNTQLVPPYGHYEVISKRGLALSGLPTPKTILIDTALTLA